MDRFAEPIKAICKEKGIEYKGCFNSQGALPQSLQQTKVTLYLKVSMDYFP